MNASEVPDRTLDGQLEERWFSCQVDWSNEDEPMRVDTDHATGIDLKYPVAFYSRDIDAAWKLVEAATASGLRLELTVDCGHVVVRVSRDGAEVASTKSGSAARAIAEALVQVEAPGS